MIVDATCDFNDAGTLTLTERVLNPKELQINVDLCKKDLLEDWQAAQMRAGAHNNGLSDDFTAFVMSYLSATIADHVEANIWTGLDSNAGEFTGFLNGAGYFELDSAIVESDNDGGSGHAYTATGTGSIITNLQTAVAALPSAVYGKDDLYIYMNKKSYRIYLSAISALSAFPFNHMGEYTKMFEGVKIAVCPGMPDDKLVVAQASNLFFGTDLLSDHTEIRMLDMADLDGSDNVRVVAKFTAGVQHAQGGDIVRHD